MPSDPWCDLTNPARGKRTGKRVSADHPWDFWWAREEHKPQMLILRYASQSKQKLKLPQLRGLQISQVHPPDATGSELIFALAQHEQKDLFYRLCLDIVEATRACQSEEAAVSTTLRRTMRWHHLLRGGADRTLGPEAQMGLIGELLVIDRILLPCHKPSDAMEAWHGPEGGPKDFVIAQVGIEAKARGSGSKPSIVINGEHQLDRDGLKTLFLHVTDIDPAIDMDPLGQTLPQISNAVRRKIGKGDPEALVAFDRKLEAAGFRVEDDYSGRFWLIGETSLYEVESDFPRISAGLLPEGVTGVSYSLSLTSCAPYKTTEARIAEALEIT
jgi:hypothetical protein